MKIEIKISDVKRSGKKVSIKESFDSLEDARAWIDKCLFVKAKTKLKDLDNERNAKMNINRCPKCGKESILHRLMRHSERRKRMVYDGWDVGCSKCGLKNPPCKTRRSAIKKWNELTKNQVTKK